MESENSAVIIEESESLTSESDEPCHQPTSSKKMAALEKLKLSRKKKKFMKKKPIEEEDEANDSDCQIVRMKKSPNESRKRYEYLVEFKQILLYPCKFSENFN